EDSMALGKIVIDRVVSHEQRLSPGNDAIGNGGADAESLAANRARLELIARFEGDESASRGLHGIDGEIEDKLKQLLKRAVPGQFAAGADQGAEVHILRRGRVGNTRSGLQGRMEIGGHGIGWNCFGRGLLNELDAGGPGIRELALRVVANREVTSSNAVPVL